MGRRHDDAFVFPFLSLSLSLLAGFVSCDGGGQQNGWLGDEMMIWFAWGELVD
jgi:hypothetical protein